MDYGYVPGKDRDRYLKRLRRAVAQRPDTTMISVKKAPTLRAFIQHLAQSSSVARPIDHIVVGGHAEQTNWELTLFTGAPDVTRFETLEATINDPGKSIQVPDAVIGFDPNDPTPPDHFHGVSDHGSDYFEWMAYEFAVHSKTKLDKAALISEFDAANMTLLDSQPVPSALWAKFLKPIRDREKDLHKYKEMRIQSRLGVSSLGRRGTVRTAIVYWPRRQVLQFNIKYPTPTDVPSELDSMDALRNHVWNLPEYHPLHPFPIQERWGFTNPDALIDALHWRFDQHGRILMCFGSRYEYNLMVPIMDPSTDPDPELGTLIFAHWPKTGTPVSQGIVETDPLFFYETVL